jgi:hypothetical protein
MASEWITLTDYGTKKAIDVNVANASTIEKQPEGTTIWFLAGVMDGKIVISETPEEIRRLIIEVQRV